MGPQAADPSLRPGSLEPAMGDTEEFQGSGGVYRTGKIVGTPIVTGKRSVSSCSPQLDSMINLPGFGQKSQYPPFSSPETHTRVHHRGRAVVPCRVVISQYLVRPAFYLFRNAFTLTKKIAMCGIYIALPLPQMASEKRCHT